MLIKKLDNYNIILGSSSIRRKELLEKMDLNFVIKTSTKKENYPKNIRLDQVASFLAEEKSKNIKKSLSGKYLLITADTIVIRDNKILHKPINKKEAFHFLKNLSDNSHDVITGVSIVSNNLIKNFSVKTVVTFNKLNEKEINYYINKYCPFDKAGSYGIQEWIGHIGVKKINGCYNNVIGLPTSKLFQELKVFI